MTKQDDPECKLQTYRGTNLAQDMSCEPASSDNEEKKGDNLSGNFLINVILFDNHQRVIFVCRHCAQKKALLMKLEQERYHENLISYVQD